MSVTIQADPELEALIGIARKAGEVVMAAYARHAEGTLKLAEKSPGDPVTEADEAANALICEALEERFPGVPVVAEESVPTQSELMRRLAADRVFFVDPIDGTHEFIAKNGQFAVMIGVAVNGRANAGVILLPTLGTLLAGRVGLRAIAEESDGRRRFVEVSRTDQFQQARMLVSRSHTPPLVEPLRRRLGVETLEPCGSVGMKVARLVLGTADVYVHDGPGMKLWDSCAGEALLAAAGGRLSDLEGQPMDYRDSRLGLRGGVVASNGVLHLGVLSAVTWARRQLTKLA